MAQLNARGGRRRRTHSEINMVPFIDVMLVLLIIFMVSAPLLPTGVVDLPSMGRAQKAPDKVIEVVLDSEDQMSLRIDSQSAGTIELSALAARIKDEQERSPGGPQGAPVIISARKDIRYDAVVRVMDTLQKGGVVRVGLAVRTTGR
ncbi:MAG TPA: biopolymer transporter ExbD [Aquabacterium sp.]|uniref:biopolymer transporter ExbD n=1 Tax=Aquabacterium sp. TaxID=1872578 RepID=UPI002E31B475|nr:biopolymer transporter ExbD [Aquabacterium sp.]HEX5374010.1 biopolymer transporter ExbD [Aquabacterium sp.]